LPRGVQVTAMPKQDDREQVGQEIGGVVRQRSNEESRNGNCRGHATVLETAHDHKAAAEPTGGDRLIGQKAPPPQA